MVPPAATRRDRPPEYVRGLERWFATHRWRFGRLEWFQRAESRFRDGKDTVAYEEATRGLREQMSVYLAYMRSAQRQDRSKIFGNAEILGPVSSFTLRDCDERSASERRRLLPAPFELEILARVAQEALLDEADEDPAESDSVMFQKVSLRHEAAPTDSNGADADEHPTDDRDSVPLDEADTVNFAFLTSPEPPDSEDHVAGEDESDGDDSFAATAGIQSGGSDDLETPHSASDDRSPSDGAAADPEGGDDGSADEDTPRLWPAQPPLPSAASDLESPLWANGLRRGLFDDQDDEPIGADAGSAGKRLMACLVDLGVLGAVDVLAIGFTMAACGLGLSETALLPWLPMAVFLSMMDAGYVVILTGAAGQTLGKRAAGLKVIDDFGGRPSYGRATLRTLGCLASLAPAGLGLLPAFFGKDRRALHDRLARTRVVPTAAGPTDLPREGGSYDHSTDLPPEGGSYDHPPLG